MLNLIRYLKMVFPVEITGHNNNKIKENLQNNCIRTVVEIIQEKSAKDKRRSKVKQSSLLC